eukprot:6465896-Amphidinium_carterae.1
MRLVQPEAYSSVHTVWRRALWHEGPDLTRGRVTDHNTSLQLHSSSQDRLFVGKRSLACSFSQFFTNHFQRGTCALCNALSHEHRTIENAFL